MRDTRILLYFNILPFTFTLLLVTYCLPFLWQWWDEWCGFYSHTWRGRLLI